MINTGATSLAKSSRGRFQRLGIRRRIVYRTSSASFLRVGDLEMPANVSGSGMAQVLFAAQTPLERGGTGRLFRLSLAVLGGITHHGYRRVQDT